MKIGIFHLSKINKDENEEWAAYQFEDDGFSIPVIIEKNPYYGWVYTLEGYPSPKRIKWFREQAKLGNYIPETL